MERIIWSKGMACKVVQAGYRVRLWEAPGGTHRELTVMPRTLTIPLESDGDQRPCDWVADDGPDVDLDVLAEKAERAAKIAAARARKNCRHKIKTAGFTQLLTLTYRRNELSFDTMRADFARWLRIMRRVIPGFRCVYGFERQGRGAWHCHVACDRLPKLLQYKGVKVQSWKVGTAIWRTVLGDGGMCFVGGRRGQFNQSQSAGRIAGYVSKYLTKDNAAGEAGRRMWDSTRDVQAPPAILLDLPLAATMADAIQLAFELRDGERVLRHWLAPHGDVWVLHTERI